MKKSVFWHLIALLKGHRRLTSLGVLFLLLSNGLLVATPLLFRHVQGLYNQGITQEHTMTALVGWCLALAGLTLLGAWYKYLMRTQFLQLSCEAEKKLKEELFTKIQGQQESFFDTHKTGDLINLLTHDLQLYRDMLHFGLFAPLNFLTLVLPCVGALYVIAPDLVPMALVPIVLIPCMTWFVMPKIYALTRLKQEKLGRLSNVVHEALLGASLVKAYGAKVPFATYTQDLYQTSLALGVMEGCFFPVFLTLTRSVTLLLAFFASYFSFTHTAWLSAADFLSFMWIQSYLFFPVLLFSWALPMVEKGKAAYDRLSVLYHTCAPQQISGTHTLEKPPAIRIENLHFTYPQGKRVLHGVNGYVPAGKMTGITGPCGSGKSTLLKLLHRQYTVAPHTLFFDDIDLLAYDTTSLLAQTALVEEIPFLFAGSVKKNVTLGKHEASLDEVIRVMQEADLHESVLQFPEQYETMVGERGVTLSGGQKKRLAMARAWLTDRPLMLLDGSLTQVDSQTERRLFEALLAKTSTRILVTDNVSLLCQMDHILFLSQGKVAEEGSPDLLLGKKGLFYAAYYLQKERV